MKFDGNVYHAKFRYILPDFRSTRISQIFQVISGKFDMKFDRNMYLQTREAQATAHCPMPYSHEYLYRSYSWAIFERKWVRELAIFASSEQSKTLTFLSRTTLWCLFQK